jgi:hypothetical protein
VKVRTFLDHSDWTLGVRWGSRPNAQFLDLCFGGRVVRVFRYKEHP